MSQGLKRKRARTNWMYENRNDTGIWSSLVNRPPAPGGSASHRNFLVELPRNYETDIIQTKVSHMWVDGPQGNNRAPRGQVESKLFSNFLRSKIKQQNSGDRVIFNPLYSEKKTTVRTYIEDLRAAFARQSKLLGFAVAFRAVGIKYIDTYDPSPTSATIDPLAAKRYVRWPNGRQKPIITMILIPPGTKILRYGGTYKELLLPPGRLVSYNKKFRRLHHSRGDVTLNNENAKIDMINRLFLIDGRVGGTRKWTPRETVVEIKRIIREQENEWISEQGVEPNQAFNRKHLNIDVMPVVFEPDPAWQ